MTVHSLLVYALTNTARKYHKREGTQKGKLLEFVQIIEDLICPQQLNGSLDLGGEGIFENLKAPSFKWRWSRIRSWFAPDFMSKSKWTPFLDQRLGGGFGEAEDVGLLRFVGHSELPQPAEPVGRLLASKNPEVL